MNTCAEFSFTKEELHQLKTANEHFFHSSHHLELCFDQIDQERKVGIDWDERIRLIGNVMRDHRHSYKKNMLQLIHKHDQAHPLKPHVWVTRYKTALLDEERYEAMYAKLSKAWPVSLLWALHQDLIAREKIIDAFLGCLDKYLPCYNHLTRGEAFWADLLQLNQEVLTLNERINGRRQQLGLTKTMFKDLVTDKILDYLRVMRTLRNIFHHFFGTDCINKLLDYKNELDSLRSFHGLPSAECGERLPINRFQPIVKKLDKCYRGYDLICLLLDKIHAVRAIRLPLSSVPIEAWSKHAKAMVILHYTHPDPATLLIYEEAETSSDLVVQLKASLLQAYQRIYWMMTHALNACHYTVFRAFLENKIWPQLDRGRRVQCFAKFKLGFYAPPTGRAQALWRCCDAIAMQLESYYQCSISFDQCLQQSYAHLVIYIEVSSSERLKALLTEDLGLTKERFLDLLTKVVDDGLIRPNLETLTGVHSSPEMSP